MFFIGVFGVQNKQKEVKYLNSIPCRNCNDGSRGKLIKTFNFFHFFFIPLFRWNEKYYVVCDDCNAVYEIPKDKGKRIENGEESEITYWDLQPVETRYHNGSYTAGNKCNNCGRTVEADFEFCPYCGARLRS